MPYGELEAKRTWCPQARRKGYLSEADAQVDSGITIHPAPPSVCILALYTNSCASEVGGHGVSQWSLGVSVEGQEQKLFLSKDTVSTLHPVMSSTAWKCSQVSEGHGNQITLWKT
ncbi:hypothetical protein CB1_001619004 [Camelus ferus]|nr:hypothetical protein CB1_001619004 [Camelus ferus]